MTIRSASLSVGLAIALLSAGCDRKSETSNADRRAEQQTSGTSQLSQLVTNIYPGSTTVRLFVRGESKYNGDDSDFLNPQGSLLTDKLRQQFEAALLKVPTPEIVAACFVPHHFFRFYDARGKTLGEVQVCFCCEGVHASGESNIGLGANQILSMEVGKMKRLVEALGQPTDINCY